MPKVYFLPEDVSIEVNQNSSLKTLGDLEQDCLFFGCRAGACGTCAIKIINGSEFLNEKNEKEEKLLTIMSMNASDHRLACQCRVSGDITIQPLDDF